MGIDGGNARRSEVQHRGRQPTQRGTPLPTQDYEQTRHFIEVFLAETESEDLKETLEKINGLMSEEADGEVRLMTEDDCPRISGRFPTIQIRLRRQTLVLLLPSRPPNCW
jgi:hypothetical protein